MRIDQYERLQTLAERLTDVFLDEAEPERWPGHGLAPAQMTKEARGDRYWAKKNAVATLSLIQRVAALTADIQAASNAGTGAAGVTEEADALDAEIRDAEKEAARLLDELSRRTRKAEFDRRTHGKP